MCTLTYLPLSTGFVLTHNRDERMNRPATPHFVEQQNVQGETLYFPQDLEAQGSWFVHQERASLCVLNGGTGYYTPNPPYRHSRGLVPLHFFSFASAEAFAAQYNFTQLEPFTLIIAEKKKLWKLIHDEAHTGMHPLDPKQAHIWSSTRLYSPEVRAKREHWFADWLATKPSFEPENVRYFQLNAGEGDQENDFRMSRGGLLKTVSITQVAKNRNSRQLFYHNFDASAPDKRILT